MAPHSATLPCPHHPQQASVGACASCRGGYCRSCTMFQAASDRCAGCNAKKARRMGLARAALGVAAVGALAAVLVFVVRSPRRGGGTQGIVADHARAAKVESLEASLAKEPCDRAKIVELGDTLVQLGEPRQAIDRAAAFFATCGEHPRLLWVTYSAHKRLGEWDGAIADATKLIDHAPEDKDFRWWRGVVYEEQGELEKAAADYRQSMTISPGVVGVPFNLATVYERMGRLCEGIVPLERFVHHHPEVADNARTRLQRLYADPACAPMVGTGRGVVRFPAGATVIRAVVTVNAKTRGRFIVDTGATFVALSPRFVKKMKLDVSSWPSVTVQTAAGKRHARVGIVDEVEIEGVRAKRIEAAAVEDDLGDIDGLLGLSFLSRFSVHLDHAKGTLEISPRS